MSSASVEETGVDTKVVLLGDSAVGKSAIALRFVRNQFVENGDPTIGACFFTKRIVANGTPLKLQIWDTAGQERFRALAPMYYHAAVAAVLVYDMTVPATFERVRSWADELSKNVPGDLVVAVVGAKADLYDALPASQKPGHLPKAAAAYAEEIGAFCCETSAKDGRGVESLFTELSRRVAVHRAKNGGGSVGTIGTPALLSGSSSTLRITPPPAARAQESRKSACSC